MGKKEFRIFKKRKKKNDWHFHLGNVGSLDDSCMEHGLWKMESVSLSLCYFFFRVVLGGREGDFGGFGK